MLTSLPVNDLLALLLRDGVYTSDTVVIDWFVPKVDQATVFQVYITETFRETQLIETVSDVLALGDTYLTSCILTQCPEVVKELTAHGILVNGEIVENELRTLVRRYSHRCKH